MKSNIYHIDAPLAPHGILGRVEERFDGNGRVWYKVFRNGFLGRQEAVYDGADIMGAHVAARDIRPDFDLIREATR